MAALQGTQVTRIDRPFRDTQDRRDFARRELFQVPQHQHFAVALGQPGQGRCTRLRTS